MLDQRGQLLRAALGFAGLPQPSYDLALYALRSWLDSWSGIGHVAVGKMFRVHWKSTGSSYSDLSKRFEILCGDKGFEIRPDNLPALISRLWKSIVDYRNTLIEHIDDPRITRGTVSAPGRAGGIITGLMYPGTETPAFRRTEDPRALLRMLEEYVEAMLAFFAVNAKKSPLIVP